MSKKLTALLVVLTLLGLAAVPAVLLASRKATGTVNAHRREMVNKHFGRPSHLIVLTDHAFKAGDAVTAQCVDAGKTIKFVGKVRKVEMSGKKLFIRLNCTDSPFKDKVKPKDPTSVTLTVTVDDGTNTDTGDITNVLADDDPDACP
jgi:hypothetical protein